ncbi:SNF2 family N-terminal domain-containing protein [Amylocystis lapponica]|nr:SNF2 family N-terminal domain-containing protein [Amylocystis lapponica]
MSLRHETTQHVLPLTHEQVSFDRPILRPDTLLHVLHAYDEDKNNQAPQEDHKGKKRAASPSAPAGGRSKRARTTRRSPSAAPNHDADAQNEEAALPAGVARLVPVYRHTYEITYSRLLGPDQPNNNCGNPESGGNASVRQPTWLEERQVKFARELEDVIRWVQEHSAAREEPSTFDLGPMHLGCVHASYVPEGGKLQARIKKSSIELLSDSILLTMPVMDSGLVVAAYGLPVDMQDPLVAFHLLQAANRAKITMRLHLITIPPDPAEPNSTALPFRLRIEVEAALACPTIFEPILQANNKATANTEDAQRRALLFLFPVSGEPPASFHGAIDIPLLYSILGPAPRLSSPAQEEFLQPETLVPTLLPFQRRSVAWLLNRDGKGLSESGVVIPRASRSLVEKREELPILWEEVQVGDGEHWYLNRVRGILLPTAPSEKDALGGILAEEPGLGKTLECITLILLNPAVDRGPSNKRWDLEAKMLVKETKTTLIVTPSSLASQWSDELAQHAPGLKVLIYNGWAKVPVPINESDVAKERARLAGLKGRGKRRAPTSRKGKQRADSDEPHSDAEMTDEEAEGKEDKDDDVIDWCAYVNTFDVCITTYTVLQQDLGVARPPPVRPRRANVQYILQERARSPLIMCEWYRVIMDEVQMVGGGKAEEMVSLIPRLSSFAVSGTPARAQAADLIHVIKFIRIEPITNSARAWARLQKPGYVHEFASVFQRYAIRTMKAAVKDELTIPRQTRFLVPIDLGRIERHVYDQSFENALLDLGLDARGVAVRAEWEVDTAALRSWLRKLRGICTHPQVGHLQFQADKLHKKGVLKTIGEVLEDMREQNWRNLTEDRRSKIQKMTTIATLQQRVEDNPARYRAALDILLAAEKEAQRLINEVKAVMAEHMKKGEVLREDAKQLRESHGLPALGDQPSTQNSQDKGKNRATQEEDSDLTDDDDEDSPQNPAGEEHETMKRALQHRLRECRITLHKVMFLKGDVYHVLGQSYADSEGEAYAAAEELRRLLLKSNEEAAKRAMVKLGRTEQVKALKEKELYTKVPYCPKGGIRSADLMEEANEMIDGLLNQQSALLWTWREKLIGLLTQSLTSVDDDADGQEYARSLETQGEAEAYLQAYAALLDDRREALTSERTLLAAHNVKETKSRKTKAAQKAANTWFINEEVIELEKLDTVEALPEHEVLYKDLSDERKALLEDFDSTRSLKSVMVDLNNVAVRIRRNEDPEKVLAKDGESRLRTLIADQGKLMDKLQADLAHLRKAFNERISYFRQLQEISDTVAEADWEGDVRDAITTAQAEQNELDAKINTGKARQRYLDHLAKSQEEGIVDEDDRCCVLCGNEFTRGYITQCAHVFCEACLKAWLGRQVAKACPVCRVAINTDQLQRFSIDQKPGQPLQVPARMLHTGPVPKSRREIEYNVIDAQLLEEIQTMESYGSYGSKIQTLIRHLLYLALTDPGSKSIIFSAWADSLHIIQHALNTNGISCLRIDQHTGRENAAKKFRTDPSISVLLLHGERENAGLNVTCASRVFLVESVVHHAFEIQAIARIDRMGQTRPTEVYCYYAEETVERNILDLAAKQGQSLYTKDNSAGTLNTTTFATDSDKQAVDSPAKKVQKGDFVFKTDDMLAIFFPHLFEDLEYLIPEDDVVPQPNNMEGQQFTFRQPVHSGNAVAGPSRLA